MAKKIKFVYISYSDEVLELVSMNLDSNTIIVLDECKIRSKLKCHDLKNLLEEESIVVLE